MFGHYSYLASILIFAGSVVALEVIFGFHFLKKYLRIIRLVVLFFLIFTPIGEPIALKSEIWAYHFDTTFHSIFLGTEIETYLFSLFVAIAISSAVIAWTFYEDQKKPILKQSLKDVANATYAIWNKPKK